MPMLAVRVQPDGRRCEPPLLEGLAGPPYAGGKAGLEGSREPGRMRLWCLPVGEVVG